MRMLGVAAAFVWLATFQASAQTPVAPPPGALFFACGPQEEVEAKALAQMSAAVPAAIERAVHLEAARVAIAKLAEFRANVFAGNAVEAPYQGTARYVALSAAASSPALTELYRRTAEDQFKRSHLSAATERVNWAAGLSDPARAYAYFIIASKGCGVDEANTRWLKAQISQNGWFTVSKYGADADRAAWLLVQHADRDLDFQTDMLSILEPLVPVDETARTNYAYLYDRVAVNRGRPQRYGTQGRCTAAGVWEPREVEQPEKLDERRAAVGLGPVAEYIAVFNCTGAPRG
jgi:hypothetical protein